MHILLRSLYRHKRSQLLLVGTRHRLLSLCALLMLVVLTSMPAYAQQAQSAQPQTHTQVTVDMNCTQLSYSSDGDPFPLCPGTSPSGGGNCTWWAWEMWHLLGYDLPRTWGNAADWIVDAQRAGLSINTLPQIGSLAVFPVGDGTWAANADGHVAFVTRVSADRQTFDMTYQSYGDPTPMHLKQNVSVSQVNGPHFQHAQLRFIDFPAPLDSARYVALPGVNGNTVTGVAPHSVGAPSHNQVALGLPSASTAQEFNADFTGTGKTDLLLYDRKLGRIDVLALAYSATQQNPRLLHNDLVDSAALRAPYRVSLEDAQTAASGWGPNLEIHLGDFTGSGHTEILLYDRVSGQIQLLTLTPQLTIATHVTLPGWGAGWEVYDGRFDGQQSDLLLYKRFALPDPAPMPLPGPASATSQKPTPSPSSPHQNLGEPMDTSGAGPLDWQTSGLTAAIQLVRFTRDFTVDVTQQYLHWHSSWEVSIGRFVSANQDGVLLYDRAVGEARLLSYTPDLHLAHFQFVHHLGSKWEVHTGDFSGQGQAQILLYDPSSGNAQMLTLQPDLSLATQQHSYTDWGAGQRVYVGHFGLPSLSLMLYNPQQARSTFVAFDTLLNVSHRATVPSWSLEPTQQILIGSFLDRTRCLEQHTCTTGDDVLVLDRQTGLAKHYAFAFGDQSSVIDSRTQAFLREGARLEQNLPPVDTSALVLLDTVQTSIHGEEVY